MEPDSIVLVVVLVAAAIGLVVLAMRRRLVVLRVISALTAVVLAMVAGMAVVNDYYGYYQSWSQLAADLSGNYAGFTDPPARDTHGVPMLQGRVESVTLAGRRSGITRGGFVYLPPQYFQPAYRHTRFPVVELVHGSPGSPSSWLVHLDIARLADRLISEHLMGPMVLVMPTMDAGRHFQECVDAPGALDGTYMSTDVRAAVTARFRVSTQPAEWGIGGYSSGGYCAADLALRHRGLFGAAGVMDGYFRPTDGPAAAALQNSPTAEAANNPISLARALPLGAAPLPAFWLSAGTGVAADIAGARAFAAALHGVEQVPLTVEPNAGHNFYAWQPALPHLLAWMWTQLAPPQLRVRFPVAGPVTRSVLPVAIPSGRSTARYRRQHGAEARRGTGGPRCRCTTTTALPRRRPIASGCARPTCASATHVHRRSAAGCTTRRC